MSGVYCDGCGEGSLLPDPGGKGKQPVACDLCGWKADLVEQPRKIPCDDEEPWTKRERKNAGKLFFLWIRFDPKIDDAVFGAMEVLGLDSMSSGGGDDSLVELEKKPTDEQMERLLKVKGVKKVRLAP